MQEKYIFSFGGGVNSAALMVMLTQQKLPLDEVVFADTGVEVPETYAFLEVARSYLERQGVPLKTVKRKGRNLFETCWEREVVPSVIWRWSTRDYKVTPIHAYYRTLGTHVNQYMAIAYDEIERMRHSRVDYVTNLYPLVDEKVTRAGCISIIEEAGLPVPVKSGCYFCPFNSADRWQWLYENHRDLYHKAMRLEEHSKHFPAQRLTDQVFRKRDHVTLRQLSRRIRSKRLPQEQPIGTPCGGECMT
jgi:3'-phosphoadenosine 5'-phosphosulfate sulfotransferase (PAPS reductase)/FAD synthetase